MSERRDASAFAWQPAAVRWTGQVSGASVIDAYYPSNTDFDTHRHESAYLCLLLTGRFTEWVYGQPRTVPSGRVVVYEEGSKHAVRTAERTVRIVHITDPQGEGWSGAVSPNAEGLVWQVAREVRERHEGRQDDAADLQLESLILELRSSPTPMTSSAPWLDAVVDHIRQDPGQALDLRALSEDAGVHPSHFARAFKARLGMAAGEFLRRMRVAEAVRRLLDTGESISAIAADLGFADQSHMGRFFKRFIGDTPGRIRGAGGNSSAAIVPDDL